MALALLNGMTGPAVAEISTAFFYEDISDFALGGLKSVAIEKGTSPDRKPKNITSTIFSTPDLLLIWGFTVVWN